MKGNDTENSSGNKITRIGLFGGTFNPVHLGHLRCMVEVKQKFELDQLIIIPSKEPPHKKMGCIIDARDRMAMIQKALSEVDGFSISDVEILRNGPSYTIDTLKYYVKSIEEPKALFLIMGLDAFLEIETWKDYEDIFSQISIVVMKRPGNWQQDHMLPEKRVERYLKLSVSEDYEYSVSESIFYHPKWNPVYLLNVTPLDISSTQIRSNVKNGRSIKYLVPKEVEAYINEKGLYI